VRLVWRYRITCITLPIMSLQQQSDELQALLDASVDGIVTIDDRGHVQRFNRSAERLFGYRAEEVVGRNVNVLMTEEDREAHDGYLARYLSTRVAHIFGKGRQVTARRKDGSVFPVWLSIGVIDGTETPRFVGFVQDLTLRRESEEQAHRLQERLWHVSRLATVGEMASGIAHELNQPLAAIANYAQACDRLLARSSENIEEVREALREITGQAVRAGDIIRRLRSLTRQHHGPRERTDVNALIMELTDLVEADARHQSVRYSLKLGSGLPAAELHPAQIQQVILNLVRNAVEALAESAGGPRDLTLRTAQAADGYLEISVCDSGPGLSPSVAQRLFEPFCTSKPAGTGLGLAISRTIVGQHGGTLDYRANTPRGACFILRLPAEQT
jgi:two-component system, LuxR family, sensor kinase FixL